MSVQSNWWESFFEGIAVSMWLKAVPQEATQSEAERLLGLLGVEPGAAILDVPCGGGRVSMAMAGRGFHLTGVDLSREFIDHARAQDEQQRVAWEHRDMRDLPWPARFDGAFCVGNSFGYLDRAGNAQFLRAVRASLKPGGRFVLETPMVLENLLEHLVDRPWWKVEDVYLLVENRYDETTQQLEIGYTFISSDGVETRHGSHQAYTYRDLVELFGSTGFAVHCAEPWKRDAHIVTFVATAT